MVRAAGAGQKTRSGAAKAGRIIGRAFTGKASMSETKKEVVDIYTDGACKGNPGVGGWGVLLVAAGGKSREIYGGEPLTTNNRMELIAVIRALEALKRRCAVRLHTDSKYVQHGITEWIHNW